MFLCVDVLDLFMSCAFISPRSCVRVLHIPKEDKIYFFGDGNCDDYLYGAFATLEFDGIGT